MYKDYEVIKYLGRDDKHTMYKYTIQIIDDDFETICDVSFANSSHLPAGVCQAIINIYSQKQLPVIENLMLLVSKVFENNRYWSFDKIINHFDVYVPEFKKYKKEIEKILLFN